MGTLTHRQLIDETKAFFANRTELTDAIVTQVLNLGQDVIGRSHDFEELFERRTGTLSYVGTAATDQLITYVSLEAAWVPKEIITFRVLDAGTGTRDRTLTYINPKKLDVSIPDLDYAAANIPQVYTQWKKAFEIWPAPDAAYPYIIRSVDWPTVFTASDYDVTSSFEHKDDIIINWAVSWLYHRLGNPDQGAKFFGFYKAGWTEAVKEDRTKPDNDIKPDFERQNPLNILPHADPWTRRTV